MCLYWSTCLSVCMSVCMLVMSPLEARLRGTLSVCLSVCVFACRAQSSDWLQFGPPSHARILHWCSAVPQGKENGMSLYCVEMYFAQLHDYFARVSQATCRWSFFFVFFMVTACPRAVTVVSGVCVCKSICTCCATDYLCWNQSAHGVHSKVGIAVAAADACFRL